MIELLLVAMECAIGALEKEPPDVLEAKRVLEAGQDGFFKELLKRKPELFKRLVANFKED